MKLDSHFERFLSAIEPTRQQVGDAKSGHTALRECLESDSQIRGALLDTFLSGSYARNTAIRPIKDVDVVVALDINPDRTSPPAALGFVQQVIASHYPLHSIELQRRSVRITLSHVNLDVVPTAAPAGPEAPLLIPDVDLSRWLPTHPKGHIVYARNLNAGTHGHFVPLVKSMKRWRDIKLAIRDRPKSFLLEVLVAGAIRGFGGSSIAEGVLFTFESLSRQLPKLQSGLQKLVVPDPVLPSNNVAEDWSVRALGIFRAEVDQSRTDVAGALEATTVHESVQLWRRVFGDLFPVA